MKWRWNKQERSNYMGDESLARGVGNALVALYERRNQLARWTENYNPRRADRMKAEITAQIAILRDVLGNEFDYPILPRGGRYD